MHLKRRHAIGICVALAAAVAATLVLSLATASAQSASGTTATVPVVTTTTGGSTGPHNACGPLRAHPCKPWLVRVEVGHGQPVAGKAFRGLTFRLISPPGLTTISWVECDAKLAGKRVSARQQSFFAGPHQRKTVVCRWRIPADAGGERLRLWKYELGDRASSFVVHVWPHTAVTGRAGNPSWIVKRR